MDMQKLNTVEMAEEILNALVLDGDYDAPDNELPDMIQQFADRIGDIGGPLTEFEKVLHVFCPEYYAGELGLRHLRNTYSSQLLRDDLTQHIQNWINAAID